MTKILIQIFWIFAVIATTINASNDEFLVQSDHLPDPASTPTLANGHLGYGVFGDRIEMNCLFNGRGGGSELARIPNWGNIKVEKVIDSNQKDHMLYSKVLYTMNTRTGVFEWETHIPTLSLKLIQRTYAHRFYNRGIVYELEAQRNNSQEMLQLHLTQLPGDRSRDINFSVITSNNELKIMQGSTKEVEDENLQKSIRTVFVVQSENLEMGKTLEMSRGLCELNYRFILTADENEEVAKNEAKKLLSLNSKQIMSDHTKKWNAFWRAFNIQIEGNLELSQVVNAGIFYLANALPSSSSFQPNGEFCGLSPQGIGIGKNKYGIGLRGSIFWDAEYFMLPIISQFSNKWARELLKYRRNRLKAARINARTTNNKGARYPWRSAFTGIEIDNNKRIYISPTIIIAVKHYFTVTNDKSWLCKTAWPMVRDIAKYLADRVSWNPTFHHYHVKDVQTPGTHHSMNDSTYVNVVFKIALEFASFARSLCDEGNNTNVLWNNITDQLYVPYDSTLDYHPQNPSYTTNEKIDGPEIIYLGYPLQYKMNMSTRVNDVNIYEAVTLDQLSQTSPIFVINFLDINENEKADFYFRKSYNNYLLKEFKIWNQLINQERAPSNYHTGFSSFLQSIINGYAGIRFNHIEGKSVMEFRKRRLLPDTKSFKIHGLHFAGSSFDLTIDSSESATLNCTHLGDKPLELIRSNDKQHIYNGLSIDLGSETAYIETVE